MIGIDFGTASSGAAVIEGGIPQIIRSKEGELAIPSTVFFTDDGEIVLTREKYERLTSDLFEDLEVVLRHCLADAGMRPEQIDEVRLVGGQARDPRFKVMVQRIVGRAPKRAAHDGVVAMGAAVKAGIIMGKIKECVLLGVTTHTLGIETKGGTFTPIIERNSTLPARKSRVFTTIADNQTRLQVHVLEGESDTAAENVSLSTLEFTDLAPERAGVPQIEVTLEVDINAMVSGLSVVAQDQATGRSRSMVSDPPANRSSALMQAKRTDSEAPSLVLLPVFPHILGVETMNGTFTPVLKGNSRIPARASRVFTTVTDKQTRVEVHVAQGESDMAAYNKSLARFELSNLPLAPRGAPQIEVTFDVDESRIISVRAEDRATGRSKSIVIPPSNSVGPSNLGWGVGPGPSRADDPSAGIRPLEEESEASNKVDRFAQMRQFDALVLNTRVETLVSNTMRSVQALEGKLTPDERRRVLEAVERANKARADGDPHELKASLAELEDAARLLGQAMLRP